MQLKIDPLNLSFEITEGETISIGRRGFGATIEIDDNNVSRIHARIKSEEGQLKVFDNKSLNGVLCNGKRLDPEKWNVITAADNLSILNYTLCFNRQPALPENGQKQPKIAPEDDLNAKFKELIRLKSPVKIGRLHTNDVVLPEEVDNDRIVSRNHAEIFFRGEAYWIKDLNSTNGTYLNDEMLKPLEPRIIKTEDVILIHLHCFNLTDGYRDLREEIAIRAEGIEKNM